MQITASTPTEQPAVAAKTYPDLWIKSIVIRAADDAVAGYAKIETRPYDYTNKVFGPGTAESITTDQLMTAISEVPELATAYGAILAAVEPLRTWVAAQQEEGEQ